MAEQNFMGASAQNNIINTNVVKIDVKAFTELQSFISKQQKELQGKLSNLGQQIGDNNDDAQERYEAQRRNDRAVNAALMGKIDKATSAVDGLKDLLKNSLTKLMNTVKDGFKTSISGYDNMAKNLRDANIDHATKIQASLVASQAKLDGVFTTGLNSIQSFMTGWAQTDKIGFKSFMNLNEKQRAQFANLGGELIERGYTEQEAVNLLRSLPKNLNFEDEETKKLLYAITQDKEGGADIGIKLYDEILRSTDKHILDNFKYPQEAMSEFVEDARRLSALNFGEKSEDIVKSFVKTGALIKGGALESLDTSKLGAVLGLGGSINSKDELLDGLDKTIRKIDELAAGSKEDQAEASRMAAELNKQIRVLKGAGLDEELITGIGAAITEHAKGSATAIEVQSYEQSKKNDKDNMEGGFVKNITDNIVAFGDTLTGGALSSLSVNLDELFGGAITSGDIIGLTATGFKEVIKLLREIHISQMLHGAFGLLKKIFPAIGGFFETKVGPFLKNVGSKIANFLKSKASAASNFIKNIGSRALNFVKNLGSRALNFVKGLGSKALNFVKGIGPRILNFAKGAFTKATALLQGLLPKFGSALGNAAKGLLPKIGAKILPFLSKVGTKLLGPIGWLITAFQGGFALGKLLVKNIFPDAYALVEKAGGYWESIKQIASFIGDSVSELWESDLQPMLGNIGNFFIEDIPKFITETIPNFFTETIPNAISEAWDSIKQWGSQQIQNIKNKLDDFFSPMRNFFKFDWLPEPVKKVLFFGETIKDAASDAAGAVKDGFSWLGKKLGLFANGGVVNKATPAVVGEAGKEAVLPLTKPNQIANVLKILTSSEKSQLIKSLLGSSLNSQTLISSLRTILLGRKSSDTNSSFDVNDTIENLSANGVPGDDPASIEKILSYAGPYRDMVYERMLHGWKGNEKDGFKKRKKWFDEALSNAANQSGRDLISGTFAEKALDWGVTQLGKPYILESLGKIGYVCNELTDNAMRKSGFDMKDFHIYGVNATFDKLKSGRRSKIKYGARKGELQEFPEFRLRPDVTPANAIPGLVFFQDSKKNKDGNFAPGHIGLVYFGNQKLHSAGGSSKYTKTEFLPNWQTPCRGVTVTPFDGGNYMFGEFPGFFARPDGSVPDAITQAGFGPFANGTFSNANIDTSNKAEDIAEKAQNDIPKNAPLSMQQRLAKTAIDALVGASDSSNRKLLMEYAQQAYSLISGGNIKEVLALLNTIAQYLKGISESPNNKKQIAAVTRFIPAPFK